MKRTIEQTYEPPIFSLSRPFHGLRLWLRPNPPMNRWAIVIRRLRRLLRQSLTNALSGAGHAGLTNSGYAMLTIQDPMVNSSTWFVLLALIA